ncbi:MAG: PEGA domain-containing protein [Myxococcota bacterium]
MRTFGCGVPYAVLLLVIYRNGGVDWLRSLGATWIPVVFGWFVWRDEGVRPFARWTALVSAVLQAMGLLAIAGLALFGPALLQGVAQRAQLVDEPVVSAPPVRPATEEELQNLGLRPPCRVSSIPAGARVFVDGKERGVTPLETRLAAGQKNTLRLELAGYFTEERILEPNANERTSVELELRQGGRLVVTSEPPGARVSVGGQLVLAKTPGPTATLEPGPTEVLVTLEGYEPQVKQLEVTREDTPLEVQLEPGVLFPIDSTPAGADVRLDGHLVGVTPLQLFVTAGRKHVIEVTKERWSTAKHTLAKPKPGGHLEVTLTNLVVAPLAKEVERARAVYDKTNAVLEKLQARVEYQSTPSLERQLTKAEKDMERAATRLEQAEAKLREAEENER